MAAASGIVASTRRGLRRRLLHFVDVAPNLASKPSSGSHLSKGLPWSRQCSHCSTLVDLRSDTVTRPSSDMLRTALTAPTGDDVMGEDRTVLELQHQVADMFQKESALFVPTGTMANLVALLAHQQLSRGGNEAMIGSESHVSLWEGGGAATLGGIHTRQLYEDPESAQIDPQRVLDAFRDDADDHCASTILLCLENTHNMLGGVALPQPYLDNMGTLAKELGIALHVDGARIFNAAACLQVPVGDLCASADSVSICLSKGLGAPLGSLLVGSAELVQIAKRHRKRLGGGMRQAGVVAAMGLYALEHNVSRLDEDHHHARRLASSLQSSGFDLLRHGQVDTNIVYFALPDHATVPSRDSFLEELRREHGVLVGGGYGTNQRFFRAVAHLDVSSEGVDRAIDGIRAVALRNR